MTDPRIEAAARALCIARRNDPDDLVWITTEPGVQEPYGPRWVTCYHEAKQALDAADAAAWRPTTDRPPSEPVLIMSQHGMAVAQWDAGIDGWRNEDTMYSPRYFTYWQPLPAPPASIAELGGVDG
ncbi:MULTISPECIES: hypothetical protein [Acetobacter]|nr:MULTISPECIES: hypothetical protein [Acetobacter]